MRNKHTYRQCETHKQETQINITELKMFLKFEASYSYELHNKNYQDIAQPSFHGQYFVEKHSQELWN